MKKIFLTALLAFNGCMLIAQVTNLSDFNTQRLQRQKTGMLVLGGWAVGNIASGLALANSRSGSDKYFHAMNAGWNAVNLAIAGFGYYGALKSDPASFDLYQSTQEQYKLQKLLLFNGGLDIGYMAGGLYLIERSKNVDKNADRLKGFGQSIILQGAFLFVFDLANYFIHAAHNEELRQFMGAIQFDGQGIGLLLSF